ncbi:MAG TPA: alpha/beta fold hydrolase [Steroidobacteraceae bacterium]|nr:alpha/beta fold hydrolase [Steroidobacteraceae bacterium]
MTLALSAALLAASINYKPPVRTINLPISPGSSQHIALHCAQPRRHGDKGVLFIHGSSFPTMLAAGFEFRGGDSWIDFMAKHGFVSCGLDFLGFGASSRPAALLGPPGRSPPALRAPEAAREIDLAITFMRRRHGIKEMHIIAHSWGTIPAADFAARHPGALTSLTLFGPLVPRPGSEPESEHVAWWSVTAGERLRQLYFKNVLPPNLVLLEPAVARRWGGEFSASAPHIAGDRPGEIRVPDGPVADIEAAHDGRYPYEPSRVTAPVFVVYGSYDWEVNDHDAPAFLARFTSSPLKWQLCIHDGTHVMHLERNRTSLYESVLAFIRVTDHSSD